MNKTNVMRLLEQADIKYEAREYQYDENDLNGCHAADAIGLPREQVFKTLVTRSGKNDIYVFCLPVNCELDLKKAAKAVSAKSIEMIHVKELLGLTGYIRGGCSPIGMKRKYNVTIDETAMLYDIIAVSAGARGCQVLLDPNDLCEYVGAEYKDITE